MKKSPLLVIFLVVFLDLVAFGIVIPILPYYSKSLGANAFALGWLMAIYSISQFLCSPIWGALSDKVGRRPVLLLTILGGSCAMVATALAQDYWVLFLARLLAGFFGANISTAAAYITDITTEKDRARGMGIIGAGFGLGFIFGPAIGGLLSVHGYHVPILLAAGMGLANFVFAFYVLEEPAVIDKQARAARKLSLAHIEQAFAMKATAIPVGLFFLSTFAFTQIEVTFGFYVLDRFGLGAQEAGWLLAGMGVIGAVLQGGLIGRLTRRYGEKRLLALGFAFLAVALAAAPFSVVVTFFALCLAGVAIGNGLVNPTLSSLVSRSAPVDRRGAVMGIYHSAGSLARAVGPPIAGLLYDRLGPPSPIWFSAALMGFAFCAAIATRRRMA